LIAGDVKDPAFCRQSVQETLAEFGRLDILVNNAAQQFPVSDVREISPEQLEHTFATNLYAYVYMVQSALEPLRDGGVIINTTSVTAFRGSGHLIDYSAAKGAITALTRPLALALVDEGIRVNAVAPGPIWTPLIPATFPADKVESFGEYAHGPRRATGRGRARLRISGQRGRLLHHRSDYSPQWRRHHG